MRSYYRRVPTTRVVWAVLHAVHLDLSVFGSYSAPDGDQFGNPNKGKMFTSYGFKGEDYPLIETETTWDITSRDPCKRENEQTLFWLCCPIKEVS